VSHYDESKYRIRDDVATIHERQFAQLAAPGGWFDGAARLALAAEIRNARIEAGVQEGPALPIAEESRLPPVARRVARQLAVDPATIERADCEQALAEGLSDTQYVEIVGIVSRLTNMDVVSRGVDIPMAPLPSALAGEPTGERPTAAKAEGAWVATVPAGKAGGADAAILYGDAMMPFIVRAMSLVPAELHDHLELEQAQYLPLHRFGEFDYQHHEGLTRPQVEVVAGRVSALNDCFY
jgi:hypothetical protein